MSIENTLVAGDSLSFSTVAADYPPADGWTMKYRMVPTAGVGTAFELSSTTADPEDATAFLFTVTGAASAAWVAGDYTWVNWVEKAPDRYTLDTGAVKVLPNPAGATALDLRSTAAKALAAIDAYLADANNLSAASYTIAGRSLSRYTRAELIAERSKWQAEVARENAAARVAAGLSDNRRIYVRWGA
jgi:hypothetical protein